MGFRFNRGGFNEVLTAKEISSGLRFVHDNCEVLYWLEQWTRNHPRRIHQAKELFLEWYRREYQA